MRRLLTTAAALAVAVPLLPGTAAGATTAAAATAATTTNAAAAPAIAAGTAPGAPGAASFYDLARKDCVGTATTARSKIWFTIADGVLSDVYEPVIDTTNVKTLEYAVTDGRSWTELQTRDLSYRVKADPSGMACTVTATSAAHGYRLVTTYVADPARDAVVMHTRLVNGAGLRLFARLDTLIGGNGGGGETNGGADSAVVDRSTGGPVPVAFDTNTVTNAANRDYGAPTYAALRASTGFARASVGYAGTASDGLAQLDADRALDTTYAAAPDGHVALTARVRLDGHRQATLALGFGRTRAQAVGVAGASARQPFASTLVSYLRGWYRYDASLHRPARSLPLRLQVAYYRSVNVVKASEDKTFRGAIAAGLASPWGQAVSAAGLPDGKPQYFGSYREVFARDLYEAFTGLLVAGDLRTARAATRFLFERQQQPDGSMPRNSLLNGKTAPDTGGIQLDESSYPLLMAWQSGLAGDRTLYTEHIRRAADYVVAHGPSLGTERWEEQSGYSPSTIAAEIAGLTAASRIARRNDDAARARLYQATADHFARNVKGWTVTTSGPYAARYFIRLSKTGDPNAAVTYNLGNGGPDADQRAVVDAGFLELTRLGILPASDRDVRASLPVVDRVIRRVTPSGPGWYRYGTGTPGSEDGYGDCYEPDPTNCSPTGKPWPTGNSGSGHLWPVLAGERAEQALQNGHHTFAASLLATMRRMASGVGLEPEQAWEDPAVPADPYGTDPTTASIGFAPGRPAGSASPLTWAQAQFARLARAVDRDRPLEQPRIVAARYGAHGIPAQLPLTVTAPADGAAVDASVTVSGTTAPGARVDVALANTTSTDTATVVSTTAGADGAWTVTAPTGFGTTVVTVTATLGRRTGYAQRTVANATLPGTTVLDVTDPAGDDNGPGTYAYPTAADFKPGAFDLTALRVSQTADDVWVQFSLRDLQETFGNPIGAQLFDLYVHDPAATATSTAAAFASRNYSIAPADAWSERIEVQGFATPVWVDANGNSLGSVSVFPSLATDTVTLRMPRSAFGTVSSGWSFVVTLHGQDGFSPDQARGFAPTPQPYQFGLCATADDPSPICGIDPGSAPKVMDTITPVGVDQATELDPTDPPVQLRGVTVS